MNNNTIEINSVINEVEISSFQERRHPLTENERNNIFLDALSSFMEKINTTSSKLDGLTKKFESLTWYNNVDEETLKSINKLIGAASDLHHVLIRNYVDYNSNLKSKGIAKECISKFKQSLDDFKEAVADLETVFFCFPEDSEFKNITENLSEL